MASTLMEQGTYIVPVPGNHETQCRTALAAPSINAATGAYVPQVVCGSLVGGQDTLGSVNGGKNAIPQNEDAFRANMGDLILDQARLASMLPNARLRVIPGGGHLFMSFQADVTGQMMKEFIEPLNDPRPDPVTSEARLDAAALAPPSLD